MNIENATVFLTGANRGLGAALLEELIAAGAPKIYAAARDPGQLTSFAARHGDKVVPVGLELTESSMINAATEKCRDVTLLINNAGVLDFAGALDTTRAEIERNMAVNFFGTHELSKAFVPIIEANGGGKIVNVLSVLAFVSAPIFAAYNSSKAASWLMAMSMRPYVAPKGISITNVFPTTIETEMVAALDKVKAKPEEVAKGIVEGIIADAEDIYPVGAQKFYDDWRSDQKAIEKYYANLA
jgi:NAD(P)-dependent dehydrogenase (short-subunit alcohol dehydrogenase family)